MVKIRGADALAVGVLLVAAAVLFRDSLVPTSVHHADMRWLRSSEVSRLTVDHQRCDTVPNTCPPNGPVGPIPASPARATRSAAR